MGEILYRFFALLCLVFGCSCIIFTVYDFVQHVRGIRRLTLKEALNSHVQLPTEINGRTHPDAEPLCGLYSDFIFMPDPHFTLLAEVRPAFKLEPMPERTLRGVAGVEDGKLIVLLDNYYDVKTIKKVFGEIEFLAHDFIEPSIEGRFDIDGAVRKFTIVNWVLDAPQLKECLQP